MKLTTFVLALASVSLTAFSQAPAQPPRMLCMFLDLRSLPAADLAAAQDQAIKFVQEQATPTDQIAVMTYTSRLNVLQGFTMDHDALVGALRGIMAGEVSAPDTPGRLQAIQALAGVLGALPQKKVVLYFSPGFTSSGDSSPEMVTAVRALMDANVSIFRSIPAGFSSTSLQIPATRVTSPCNRSSHVTAAPM